MRLSSLALFAALLVLASCVAPVDTNQAVGPLSLSVVSGNNQTGPPGTELPAPIVALVEDSRGHAVRGQIVNFVVVSGGGGVFAGAAISGGDGIVQERWTLGFSGPQQVEARAVDNATGAKITFATFTATLTDVQPPVVSGVATSPANPTAGTPFDLAAIVSDAATGGSNIASATYSVDGGAPVAMSARDGAFDQQNEAVLAHVTVASAGSHVVCVTGRDAAGNVSSPSCITVVVAEAAIYVSPAGDDAANGTRDAPLKTIGAALALAGVSGKNRVNVAQGTYPENVQLRAGISLYGGYDAATWTRVPATFVTTIAPGPSTPAVAVQGDNVTGVTIDGFTIRSGDAVSLRESAYGIVLTNSVATISGNHVIAGNGTAGTDGFTGFAGQNGVVGNDGQPERANGLAGTSGQHGGSGGGGGGGGGLNPTGGGNGGGSGGTGGCAGSGGGGGGGAGGSFGIVGVLSTLTVSGNTIETGNGGGAGAAGAGAAGGTGGAGGLGATNDAPQVGAGGNGGAGGGGGAGGPGGGGGGGPSIGIVAQGGSLAQSGNVFVLGNGGAGGAAPGGNAGSNGLRVSIKN